MNDKEFKKHLHDLARGHHHPEEHDWGRSPAPKKRPAKSAKKSAPRRRKAA